MALLDYLGRTVDLLAFTGVQESGDQQLQMQLAAAGEGGQVCTGMQKLMQRFLRTFFKETGSDIFRPTDGTEFMTRLNRGELRNQVDVLVAFAEAQLDCKRLLKAEETDADPDDERYASAAIESLAVAPGSVKLYIRLTSRAGDSRKVILPVSILTR